MDYNVDIDFIDRNSPDAIDDSNSNCIFIYWHSILAFEKNDDINTDTDIDTDPAIIENDFEVQDDVEHISNVFVLDNNLNCLIDYSDIEDEDDIDYEELSSDIEEEPSNFEFNWWFINVSSKF